MKNIPGGKKIAVFIIFSLTFLACSSEDEEGDVVTLPNTTVNFIQSNPEYSILNAALNSTNLKSFLGGADFTIFAPNNTAFNFFLSTNGYENINAVPTETLTALLLYHMIPGDNLSEDLLPGYVETASSFGPGENKLSLHISIEDNIELNGDANVLREDIQLANGVIHTVDKVLNFPDISTFLKADPDLKDLFSALTREENFLFLDFLSSADGPALFTVFAPSNDAFISLLEELEVDNIDDIPVAILLPVLNYHIVAEAQLRSDNITDGMVISTLQNKDFIINLDNKLFLTDERGRISGVIRKDVQATNGVIHIIDKVLLPERLNSL